MKNILLLLVLVHLNSFSQKLVTGVGTSYYFDNFPSDLYGSVMFGFSWDHIAVAPVFSKTLGYRQGAIEELGLTARFQVRPQESLFNVFFETSFSAQISGKRSNKAVDDNLSLVEETSFRFHGERFLKESFTGFFGAGISFTYKDFQLFSSFGYSARHWKHYNDSKPGKIIVSETNGFAANLGLRYFIPLKKRQEKYIIVPSPFQESRRL